MYDLPGARAPWRRLSVVVSHPSWCWCVCVGTQCVTGVWPRVCEGGQVAKTEDLHRPILTREAFCQVAPRPLRGPRTSNFDKILTWGCVRSPNRSEPSRSCVESANTALREARRTPRFGHIWQVVAGANSGERGGRHAFYRHTESAISVFRPPAAQLSIKSTFTKD